MPDMGMHRGDTTVTIAFFSGFFLGGFTVGMIVVWLGSLMDERS